MAHTYELFHGSPAAGILGIINEGRMHPDATHRLFYSERFEDALQHGADTERKASFAFKAQVTVIDGAAVERVAKSGNPLTVLVTTALPLPTKILELYVQLGRVGEFELKVIKGVEAIKAHLLQGLK
jgi:hypothetical protein